MRRVLGGTNSGHIIAWCKTHPWVSWVLLGIASPYVCILFWGYVFPATGVKRDFAYAKPDGIVLVDKHGSTRIRLTDAAITESADGIFTISKDVLAFWDHTSKCVVVSLPQGVKRSYAFPKDRYYCADATRITTNGRHVAVDTRDGCFLLDLSSAIWRKIDKTTGSRLDPLGSDRIARHLADGRLVVAGLAVIGSEENVIATGDWSQWDYDFETGTLYAIDPHTEEMIVAVPSYPSQRVRLASWGFAPMGLAWQPQCNEVWITGLVVPFVTTCRIYNRDGLPLGRLRHAPPGKFRLVGIDRREGGLLHRLAPAARLTIPIQGTGWRALRMPMAVPGARPYRFEELWTSPATTPGTPSPGATTTTRRPTPTTTTTGWPQRRYREDTSDPSTGSVAW